MSRSRWFVPRGALVLVVIVVLVVACGPDHRAVLSKAQDRLSTARHGWIDFQITSASSGGAVTGVRLSGTYRLRRQHRLPTVDLTYVNAVAGAETRAVRVRITGDSVFTGPPAQLRELTPTEAASLRLPSSGHAPLLDLEFARWMTDPRSADRPHGKTITSGGVDGAALLRNIVPLIVQISGDHELPAPSRAALNAVQRRVIASRMDVITRADGSVDRLSALVQFSPGHLQALRAVLGAYAGAELAVGLRFRHR